MTVEVGAARQRIIRRPRLTSMLDESTAKVRMLIAPAGYGKTTLARQWLGEPERRDVWYRGGAASADVAALAAGIAEAAAEIIPDAGKRMRDRLRATGHPEEDVDILAELFAEDVQAWPADAWLAIDDYHFAMESAASERFVDLLTQQTPLQMLITSRRRPAWATARRIVYGELFEIDRRALAMGEAEARDVLGPMHPDATDLVERARGWPALLGLAALSGVLPDREASLPGDLYEYFAEELLHGLSPSTQSALSEVAVFPSLTPELGRRFLGTNADAILADGVRVGVITQTTHGCEVHPLLRQFLVARLAEGGRARIAEVADRAMDVLLAERRWDEAFDVVSTLSTPELIPRLVGAALEELLQEGRVQTVAQWLDAAHARQLGDEITELAEAELAFRQGDWTSAESLAVAAAHGLRDGRLRTRAFIRAGHAARLDSRDDVAIRWFRSARESAENESDQFEALVGEYFALLELGVEEDVANAVTTLKALAPSTPDMAVRRAMAELVRATRQGGISQALEVARSTAPLLARVRDPLVKSSFQNGWAHLSALNARYTDALELSGEQLLFAGDYRLDFVLPPAHLVRAIAYSGIREFSRAREEIRTSEARLRQHEDVHLSMWSAALRARISLDHCDFDGALEHTRDRWGRAAAGPMRSELLAYAFLAAVCKKDTARSKSLQRDLRASVLGVEAKVLIACGQAVESMVASVDANDADAAAAAASAALETAERTGAYDCFVTAVRAFPELLSAVVSIDAKRDQVALILEESNDRRLAQSVGLSHDGIRRGPTGTLTPRELEVARLVAAGYSNRMIASDLFISESTVKVHVRHILKKLGARTRTEAATRIADLA